MRNGLFQIRRFHPRDRERRVPGKRPREIVGGLLELASRHDRVHHADLVRAFGVDRLSGQQDLAGERGTDDLDQLLTERERYDEPDLGQRHREARRVGRDAKVAVQRELASARVGRAVDHRDRRMARSLDLLEERDHIRLGLEPVVLPLAHLVEIAA